MWMNRHEIEEAVYRHKGPTILGRAARFLHKYMEVVDSNSDGWPYWKAGSRAAKQLMDLVQERNQAAVTEIRLRKALVPIRNLCKRRGLTAPELD